jgi:hypothetical protein
VGVCCARSHGWRWTDTSAATRVANGHHARLAFVVRQDEPAAVLVTEELSGRIRREARAARARLAEVPAIPTAPERLIERAGRGRHEIGLRSLTIFSVLTGASAKERRTTSDVSGLEALRVKTTPRSAGETAPM